MGLVRITAVNGAEGCTPRLSSALRGGGALCFHDQAAEPVRAHVMPAGLAFLRGGFHDVGIDGTRAQQLDEQGGNGGFIHVATLPDPQSGRQHPCLYR